VRESCRENLQRNDPVQWQVPEKEAVAAVQAKFQVAERWQAGRQCRWQAGSSAEFLQ